MNENAFAVLLTGALVWIFLLIGILAVGMVRAGDTARRLVMGDLSVQLAVVALALVAMSFHERYYLDAAVALAILSFVSSIVVAGQAVDGD